MIDEVIKISPRSNDLPKTKEFWQSDTYDERENAIRSFIVNVKKAPPSRICSISVKESSR